MKKITIGKSLYYLTIILSLLCSLSHQKPAYAKAKLDPIDLKVVLSMESAHVLNSNSTNQQSEQRAVLILPLSISSKDILSYDIGTLNIQGMLIKDDPDLNAGRPLLNDYHAYSNLRAEDRMQVFEMYWEKSWASSKTFDTGTVRLGKIDANDHFAVSDHESYLLNGASGFSPSIFGLPSYPDSAWHLSLEQKIQNIELKFGVFDGGSTSLEGTPTGQNFGLSPSARRGELFYIFETTIFWGDKLNPNQQINPASPADTRDAKPLNSVQQDRDFKMDSAFHLSLGIWKHEAKVIDLKQAARSSHGVYAVGDVELARLGRHGELGLGFQLAHSPHYHPWHASLALIWDKFMSPLAWAGQAPSMSWGLSYLRNAEEAMPNSALMSKDEKFIEWTIALPVSDSLLLNMSWMSIQGQHLPQRLAHLLLGRLTIGAI